MMLTKALMRSAGGGTLPDLTGQYCGLPEDRQSDQSGRSRDHAHNPRPKPPPLHQRPSKRSRLTTLGNHGSFVFGGGLKAASHRGAGNFSVAGERLHGGMNECVCHAARLKLAW